MTRLRENATNGTAALSDMPRPDSPNIQRMEETICKIVDLEHEINADIDRLVDLKAEARKAINCLLYTSCTQAIARDLLAHAMQNLEAACYPIVFHVHDEAVMELSLIHI